MDKVAYSRFKPGIRLKEKRVCLGEKYREIDIGGGGRRALRRPHINSSRAKVLLFLKASL